MLESEQLIRCEWCLGDELYISYHDNEWGKPLHEDRKLFEFLTLEGAQAGLSWLTILKRRDGYRLAFDNFDINKIVNYNEQKITELIQDIGIVRNKLKILSTIENARASLKLIEEFGSLDKYFWDYTNQKTINMHDSSRDISKVANDISVEISKDLRKRGFNFIGPTICYAFIQAIGMINDHQINCYRYKELSGLK